MRLTINRALILIALLLCSALYSQGVAQAAFADIENNWAKEAISALDKEGLFLELWEEEFGPHNTLDHQTGLELLARAFQLEDAEQERLFNWLQGSFTGDSHITRGEFAALLANVLGVGEHQKIAANWYPSFVDLDTNYPGFAAIEILHKLQLLPSHMLVRFEPFRLITRSEVAHLIHGALGLSQLETVIEESVQDGDKLLLSTKEGDPLVVSPETILITDQGLAKGLSFEMGKGQEIFVLRRNERALLVRFDQESTAQVLLQGFNNLTQVLADVLTPEQVSAIIAGDWGQLNEEVQYELYNELVKRGAAPWEAEALLKQDWSNLQLMLQDRLTQEAASYLQVTPELVHSAVTRDWSKLLEYAQVELAQRLLTSDWLRGITQE